MGLSGCRRGQGCTTLLLIAAKRLAARGLKVVMVDANFENPMLARRLGLLPEAGWEKVLTGDLSLAEVLIESIEDRLAILPLQTPASSLQEGPDLAGNLDPLRQHFDVVLVDLGRCSTKANAAGGPLTAGRRWLDAVVLVNDVRCTPRAELIQAAARLRATGLVELGVAENYV